MMENKCKRFLSLLLAFVMVLGMFPAGHVHAATDTTGTKSSWTAIAVSSEKNPASGNDGPLSNAWDGNDESMWHSRYGNGEDKIPVTGADDGATIYGIIDLGSEQTINWFSFRPRKNGSNGRVTQASLYVGTKVAETGNVEQDYTWEALAEHQTFDNNELRKIIYFDEQPVRYVKFVAEKSSTGHVCVSEFDIGLSPRAYVSSTDADSDEMWTYDRSVLSAFDGDKTTFWSTNRNGNVADQYLIVDLGSSKMINQVDYTWRNGNKQGTGNLLNYEIRVSDDMTNWGEAVASGDIETIADANGVAKITFTPVRARYVKLTSTSSFGWNGAGNKVMCVGEFAVHEHEHDWNEGKVTTAPTLNSTGVKTFDCSECSATKTEVISALTAKNAKVLSDNTVLALSDCEYVLGGTEGAYSLCHGGTYYVNMRAGGVNCNQTTTASAYLNLDWDDSDGDAVSIWQNTDRLGYLYIHYGDAVPKWNVNGSYAANNCDMYLLYADANSTNADIPGYTIADAEYVADHIEEGESYLIAAKNTHGNWFVMVPSVTGNAVGDYIAQVVTDAVTHTHDYTVETVTKDPTCAETGLKDLKCSCGHFHAAEHKNVEIPAAHGTITHVDPKAANCTEAGNVEHWRCETCGETWSDEACEQEIEDATIPALGHCWDRENAGYCVTDYTCCRCGEETNPNFKIKVYFDNTKTQWEAVEALFDGVGNVGGWARYQGIENGMYVFLVHKDAKTVAFNNGSGGAETITTRKFAVEAGTIYSADLVKIYFQENNAWDEIMVACNDDLGSAASRTTVDGKHVLYVDKDTADITAHFYLDGEYLCSADFENVEAGKTYFYPACTHSYTYDCDTDCKVCGQNTRPSATHVSDAVYDCVAGKCQYCETPMEAAASHTPAADDSDCTTAIACSVCGREATAAKSHAWAKEGTYTEPTFEADGFTTYNCTNSGCNETDVVTHEGSKLVAVAQIGNQKFTSLQAAFDAVQKGDDIELLKDIELDTYLTVDNPGNYCLDLHGHNITRVGGTAIYVNNNATTLSIEALYGGKVTGEQAIFAAAGTVKIYRGTFHGTGDAIYAYGTGHIVIYGGTFSAEGPAGTQNAYCVLNVHDGSRATASISVHCDYKPTFIGFNPADNLSEGAGTNFLAIPYYYCSRENNGKWTVVEGHDEVVDQAKAATCTETGLTGGMHCSACGKVLVKQDVIPAKDHSWDISSYTNNGANHTVNYGCKNDASHTKSETEAHNFTNGDCVCGEKAPVTYVAEADGEKFATLQEAVDSADDVMVTLLADVELTERLDISGYVILELNGHTISGDVEGAYGMIYVKQGATLNIEGAGYIIANKTHAIGNYGTVHVHGGNIVTNADESYAALYNFYYQPDYYGTSSIAGGSLDSVFNCGGLHVYDGHVAYLDNSGDMRVRGGQIDKIYARDGSDAPGLDRPGTIEIADPANITVPEGFKLVKIREGVYQVVAVTYVAEINGEKYETLAEALNDAVSGDTVKLLADCEFESAVPEGATLDLNGHALMVTGPFSGCISINNGAIKLAADQVLFGSNGAFITTDGVLYISTTGFAMTGGTFMVKDIENEALVATVTGTAKLVIENCKFKTFTAYLDSTDASIEAPEGMNVTTTLDGYEVVYEDGTYTLVEKIVARIGVQSYTTLAAALNAAQSGDTVKLLADCESAGNIPDGAALDLNGHKLYLTITRPIIPYGCIITNGGAIAMKTGEDDREFVGPNGTYKTDGAIMILSETGFTMIAGTVTLDNDVSHVSITVTGTAKLVFNDCTIEECNLILDSTTASIEGPEDLNVTTTQDGYEVVYENGTYTLVEKAPVTYVAMIGEQGYATLAAAIAAAQEGDIILLVDDVTEEIQISDNAVVDLDLNGKTLTGCFKPFKGNLTVKNGSIVNTNSDYSAIEINAGELVLNNVIVTSARHAVRIDGAVTATIDGGEYKLNAVEGTRHALNVSGAAVVTIKAGTFVGPKGTTMDSGSAVNAQAGAKVIIEGGSFSGGKNSTLGGAGTITVYGGTFDQNPTARLAEGYCAKAENGVYTVQAHTWNEGEVTKAATCIAKGEKTFTCNECGGTKTEEIPADPDAHLWIPHPVGGKAATCVEAGYKNKICLHAMHQKRDPIPALGHTFEREGGDRTETCCGDCGAPNENLVAKIGEHGYATLTEALSVAQSGDTIVLLKDITEDVTVSKSVTIDGAGKTYTGKMNLTNKADITIKNVNFDGNGYNGYAVQVEGAYYITIEDCTAKNYGYGFLQVASDNVSVNVKNVAVSDCSYGIKVDYNYGVTLENVDLDCSVAGLLNSNYGEKTITIKNSDISILGTWTRNNTIKTTYVFEGANSIDEFITDAAIDNFKLAAGATLTAPQDITVTTDVEDHEVVYENGTYKLVEKKVAVAMIGEQGYETLAAAIAAAKAGDTITFVADITEDVTVSKSVTIDGAGKTYTGTMTGNKGLTITIENVNFVNGGFSKTTQSSTGTYTIKNCTFDGQGTYAYPVRIRGANKLVVEDCVVSNYLYSFLYVYSGTTTVSVKNVIVENCPNYAVYFASGVNNATFENLTVKNSENGFVINNTANRSFTIKDCKMENVGTAINYSSGTKAITCTAQGNNDFGTAVLSEYAKVVLTENATLTAPEGLNVTTNVENHEVKYENGTYKVVEITVAKIGRVEYTTLQEAVDAAKAGQTITLLRSTEGAGVVINKNLTIDFAGHTYSLTVPVGSTGTESNGFQILAGNTVTLRNGTLKVADSAADKFYILIQNYADLKLNSITLDGRNLDKYAFTDGDSYVLSNNSGNSSAIAAKIIVNDNGDKAVAFDVCKFGNYTEPTMNIKVADAIYVDETTLAVDYAKYVEAAAFRGNYHYATLQQAVDLGGTVTLFKDIAGPGVVIRNDVNINFANHTYTITEPVGSTGTESNGFQILKGTDVVFRNGTLKVADSAANKFYILVQNYSDSLSMSSMTLDGTNLDKYAFTDGDSYTLSNNSGNVNIGTGTKIIANNDGALAFAFDACDQTDKGYDLPVVTVHTRATIEGNIEAAAKIGNVYYATLQQAIDAAGNGKTITLMSDINLNRVETVLLDGAYNTYFKVEGKTLTIDLNGKTISGAYTDTSNMLVGLFSTDNGGHLTLTGNGTVNLTEGDGAIVYALISNYEPGCTITIEDGSYILDSAQDCLMHSSPDKGLIIKGGNFELGNVAQGHWSGNRGNGSPWIINVNGKNAGAAVVSGGTYNYDISNQHWIFEVAIEDGKGNLGVIVDNGDGTWTVTGDTAEAAIVKLVGNYTRLQGYATIEAAAEAAKDGDTIILKRNVEFDTITVDKNLTIDANGYKIAGKFVLANAAAALTAPEGLNVTTTVKNSVVKYIDGAYKVVAAVAKTGDGKLFATLEEAVAYANANLKETTISLLKNVEVSETLVIDTAAIRAIGTSGKTIKSTADVAIRVAKNTKSLYIRGTLDTSAAPAGSVAIQVETASNVKLDSTTKIVAGGNVAFKLIKTAKIISMVDSKITAGQLIVSETKGAVTFDMHGTTATISGNYKAAIEIYSGKLIVTNSKDAASNKNTIKVVGEHAVYVAGTNLANYAGVIDFENQTGFFEKLKYMNVTTEAGYQKYFTDMVQNANTGKCYGSLSEAVNAAADGDTVTVLADHELVWDGETVIDGSLASMIVVAGKSVTIDLNGKKLTVDASKMNGTDLYAVFAADEGGMLTLTGNGTVTATGIGFKSNATAYCLMMAYEAGTKLVVENGTYTMEAAGDSLIYSGTTANKGEGDQGVIVMDGIFNLGNVGTGSNGKPWIFNTLGSNQRHAWILGGTFNADVNHQYWIHEAQLPGTLALKNNGDGTWTVVEAAAYVVEKHNGYSHNVGYVTVEEAQAAAAAKGWEVVIN